MSAIQSHDDRCSTIPVADEQRHLLSCGRLLGLGALVVPVAIGGLAITLRRPQASNDPQVLSAIAPFAAGLSDLGKAVSEADLRVHAMYWRAYAAETRDGRAPAGEFNPAKISGNLDQIKAAALKLAAACDESKRSLDECKLIWQPKSDN